MGVLRGCMEEGQVLSKHMRKETDMGLIKFVVFALVLAGCGADDSQCAAQCTLVGSWTEVEAHALTQVTGAMQELGLPRPTCWVNFVHSPDAEYKGVAWKDYRIPGVKESHPGEGYQAIYSHEYCMALVRRYGEAGPYLVELLIHELLHSVGYAHGDVMRQAEQEIEALALSRYSE